jgi:hypothetical protein
MEFVFALISAMERLRDLRESIARIPNQSMQISWVPNDLKGTAERIVRYIEKNVKPFEFDAALDRIQHITTALQADSSLATISTELRVLSEVIEDQAGRRHFIYVPLAKADYFMAPDEIFSDAVFRAFPCASYDIIEACSCYAAGRNTACVFHSMGILQQGLYALASDVGVVFAEGIELENWKNVIDGIEKKIRELEGMKTGQVKDAKLKAYSEAAVQFRYFKDAWRNHVAHLRATYDDDQAHSTLVHVRDFMKQLTAMGLKESANDIA